MKIAKPFLLMSLLIGLFAVAPVVMSGQVDEGFSRTVEELHGLEPYVTEMKEDGVHLQALDAASARNAGISPATLALAREVVAFQNDLVRDAAIGGPTRIGRPQADRYPLAAAFFDRATQRHRARLNSALASHGGSVNPCGDYDHPVPNYAPPRYDFPSSDPGADLTALGFHPTAGYACYNCGGTDWTRGRDYNGPYGYCSSPRFRDHGQILSPSLFNIQYGEPNPEIHSYVWPYWNWPFYVSWWHETF